MTTTLRPSGPLRRFDDGTLSRSYAVCVDSRPVGAVRVGTLRLAGRILGTIADLRVDEADRGRGRGAVAALAAEEVLRGWRCDRVRVSVPAGARAALRLAAALGYTESGHVLVKGLDPAGAAPPLPAGLEIRPMTDAESARWIAAEPGRAALLPDGPAAAGALLHVAVRDGVRVGHLWTGRRDLPTGDRVPYVWDIAVAEGERRRGCGRALMRFAEGLVRAAGGDRLVLRVDPGNAPARTLYASLGYRPLFTDHEKTLH
ncbi:MULTISPECIES: GNAT family N-acetyltransferase [Streptomyces]|uniref:GNAT family N-acetyltransferase n=1 Tax=Streptomyces sudanensis TaxID=436397 RepID=A0ABY4TGH4_9ACTN|nr:MULTISPECIES: GNAT family N-acetyltransferase [Streptomyces]URN17991.1 GNAT family N-acetyltransferase [Streptomyces sudanensis]